MKIAKSQLKQIIREEVDVTLGEPIPAEGLADAIAQDISDMYKEMNGIRPRWYEFDKMPLEELEDLHGKTVKDLQNYYAEEEHQDRQAWRDDDPESIARGKEIEAEYEAEKELAAAAAEEERMKTPEQGEEFPKRAGIKRRVKEQIMKITKSQLKDIVYEELEAALAEQGTDCEEDELEEDKDWIGKAVDPDHKGDCTPMTKSTCTPPRKALAKRFKKAAKKKEKKGGTGWQGKV